MMNFTAFENETQVVPEFANGRKLDVEDVTVPRQGGV